MTFPSALGVGCWALGVRTPNIQRPTPNAERSRFMESLLSFFACIGTMNCGLSGGLRRAGLPAGLPALRTPRFMEERERRHSQGMHLGTMNRLFEVRSWPFDVRRCKRQTPNAQPPMPNWPNPEGIPSNSPGLARPSGRSQPRVTHPMFFNPAGVEARDRLRAIEARGLVGHLSAGGHGSFPVCRRRNPCGVGTVFLVDPGSALGFQRFFNAAPHQFSPLPR